MAQNETHEMSDDLRDKVAKAIEGNMIYVVKKREAKVFADAAIEVVSERMAALVGDVNNLCDWIEDDLGAELPFEVSVERPALEQDQ